MNRTKNGPIEGRPVAMNIGTKAIDLRETYWDAEGPTRPAIREFRADVNGDPVEISLTDTAALPSALRAFADEVETLVAEAGHVGTTDLPPAAVNSICVRCDGDTDFAASDLPAPGWPGRKVCATEDGEIGEIACGLSDVQIAVQRDILRAGRAMSPDQTAEWAAAHAAAMPLLDEIAEGLAAFLVRDEGAWVAIANYALTKLAERTRLPGEVA